MWPSSTACAPASNKPPVVNSWSKPAIGTPCSERQSNTVPWDTSKVGSPSARACVCTGARPRSNAAMCSPVAPAASAAPAAAATAARLTVGKHETSALSPSGRRSKHQPVDATQRPAVLRPTCPMQSATCTA